MGSKSEANGLHLHVVTLSMPDILLSKQSLFIADGLILTIKTRDDKRYVVMKEVVL
jgi:hypothetical protein